VGVDSQAPRLSASKAWSTRSVRRPPYGAVQIADFPGSFDINAAVRDRAPRGYQERQLAPDTSYFQFVFDNLNPSNRRPLHPGRQRVTIATVPTTAPTSAQAGVIR
jgi:hypothetical protein